MPPTPITERARDYLNLDSLFSVEELSEHFEPLGRHGRRAEPWRRRRIEPSPRHELTLAAAGTITSFATFAVAFLARPALPSSATTATNWAAGSSGEPRSGSSASE